jgi:hypothetical protein
VVFDLTLQRFKGRDGSARWLVSSFLPAGSSGDDTGSGRLNPFAIGTQEPGPASHTSSTWLFLPLGIFGSLLLVLVVLGIRGWRGARIYRAHVRERQISSSRPS